MPPYQFGVFYLKNLYADWRNESTGSYLTVDTSTSMVHLATRNGQSNQQWRLIPIYPNYYKFQNIGNSEFLGTTWGDMRTYPGPMTAREFNIAENTSIGSAYYQLGLQANDTCMTYSDGKIHEVKKDTRQTFDAKTDESAPRQYWIFDPIYEKSESETASTTTTAVVPSTGSTTLTKGHYRIRSFQDKYLLTMPKTVGSGLYITKQVASDVYQKWLVTPQTDGTFTISNAGNALYLAPASSSLADGIKLIGQSAANESSASQWNIKTATNPGFMYFIELKGSSYSVGFADNEAEESSEVALETSDNIPSQVWFFEKYKEIGLATFHGDRYLKEGNYKIELLHDNTYLSRDASKYLTSVLDIKKAAKFTVTYEDANTPYFTLHMTLKDSNLYLHDANDHIDTSTAHKTQWVATSTNHSDGEMALRICMTGVNAEDRRVAISSRQIEDKGYWFFALDTLAPQDVTQLFRFHKI